MIVWTNSITNERSSIRPWRVRLEDGSTRTGPEVTDELLTATGWSTHEEIFTEPVFTASTSTSSQVGE